MSKLLGAIKWAWSVLPDSFPFMASFAITFPCMVAYADSISAGVWAFMVSILVLIQELRIGALEDLSRTKDEYLRTKAAYIKTLEQRNGIA